MKTPPLSIVGPVYNEEACLGQFYAHLKKVLRDNGLEAEIIFVNDGSKDGSLRIMEELQKNDPDVRIVSFSRNFGHQIAVKAGIDHAHGDAVVIMDTDLQDPPEAIPQLLQKWKEGYEVVYTVHVRREGEGFLKKITATLFYRLIQNISNVDLPLDAGDFRLIDRRVADTIRAMKEKAPYIRGLVSWIGFRQTGLPIHRDPRFAGKTKYSPSKMFKLAWDGITHFSFLPLQISTYVGIVTSVLCVLWILFTVYEYLFLHNTIPGWASLMVAVLFLGSVQLITLGIIGSYLTRTYDESLGRPLYIVDSKKGF